MLVTYSSLDIIANECHLTPNAFKAALAEDPAAATAFFNMIKAGILAHVPLILEKSIGSPSGAVLIEAGANMMPRLQTFLRIAARNSAVSWPIILPNEILDAYLRSSLRGQLQQISKQLLADADGVVHRIYTSGERAEDLHAMKTLVFEIVDRYLSRPEVIAGMLRSVTVEAGHDQIAEAVTRAWLAVVVYRYHPAAGRHDPREELQQVGLAAMFQDISCLMGVADESEHAEVSAVLAESMGIDPVVVEAIVHHHRLRNDEGMPILRASTPPLIERVLVAVNTFVELLDRPNLNTLWIMYVMHHMVKNRFLDPEAVRVIGTLYGESRRDRLMAVFSNIIARCVLDPHRAYPWSLFEEIPRIVICNRTHCEHAADATADITVHEPVVVPYGDTQVLMRPGDYFKCPFLTSMVRDILAKEADALNF